MMEIKEKQMMEIKENWEAMELLVHAKDFDESTAGIPEFWDEYYANEAYKKIPVYLGVCAQKKSDKNVFRYGIGCQASDVEGVPEGFEILHIPKYTWAVFKCVDSMPKMIQVMRKQIEKELLLPTAEYEMIPDYDIEFYYPSESASPDCVCELWIPVKKK